MKHITKKNKKPTAYSLFRATRNDINTFEDFRNMLLAHKMNESAGKFQQTKKNLKR